MSSEVNSAPPLNPLNPPSPADLNAPFPPHVEPPLLAADDIVSVNKKGSSDNKVAKGIFLLVAGAVLVGVLMYFSQNWLNARKAQMKTNSGPKAAEDTSQVFNPEKTGAVAPKPKLGSDSGAPPPSQVAVATAIQPGASRNDGIRPLRGADGKVMVNAQGRAMGVDKDGNVVEVPAITAMMDEPAAAKKALPGQAQGAAVGQQAAPKPPSRYGGSLFVGDTPKPAIANTARGVDGSAAGDAIAQTQAQQIAELLRAAGAGGGAGGGQASRTGAAPPTAAPSATPFFGQPPGATLNAPPEQVRPGTIGSALFSSATPVSFAKRMNDQNLLLPKGRQADCILTGRIVDDVPGFTSCALAQNLYSDNGRVLLLERGSELTGEYGISNQLGSERLFVTWSRVKTPDGIEIDLSSPGSDRLGTSGLPGHLDNRWGARIGAALLLSVVKDVAVAVINNQSKSSGTAVNVQTSPGQNTMNGTSALAEEVIKQTIKVRPRLTINEGDRIAIYVARDLDFSPVYALKTAGTAGATRLLSK
jgi:type IV secretion system protein VirB10